MRMKGINIMMLLLLLLLIALSSASVDAYRNYTVGDSLGWYDTLENPKVDYQKWAAAKNFSLGDFLIFNTDNNHSVIQTYNSTTYNLCDYDNAPDNDTLLWAAMDPSSTAATRVSKAVPLLKTGTTYFFSSGYDGEQCRNGQHLKINVTYGQGLPPSLRSDDSPSPTSPVSGDDDSAPETLVPSNFDDPKDVSDEGAKPSESVSLLSERSNLLLLGLFVVIEFLSF